MSVTDLRLPSSLAKKVAVSAEYAVDFSKFNRPIRKKILNALEGGCKPEDEGYNTQARQVIELLSRRAPVLNTTGLSRMKAMVPEEQWEEIAARALMMNLELHYSGRRDEHVYLNTWRNRDGGSQNLVTNISLFNSFITTEASKLNWREVVPPDQVEFIDAAAEAARTRSVFTFKLELNPDEL